MYAKGNQVLSGTSNFQLWPLLSKILVFLSFQVDHHKAAGVEFFPRTFFLPAMQQIQSKPGHSPIKAENVEEIPQLHSEFAMEKKMICVLDLAITEYTLTAGVEASCFSCGMTSEQGKK